MQTFGTIGSITSLSDDKIILGMGPRTWHPSLQNEPTWYAPDFFLKDECPFFTHKETKIVHKDELLKTLSCDRDNDCVWKDIEWTLFEEKFHELKKILQEGVLKKGVPYLLLEGKMDVNVIALLKCLLEADRGFCYGFWDETQGMIGLSPEVLVKGNYEQLETMACAGTVWEQESHSLKNLEEHACVVEGISKSLASLAKVDVHEQKNVSYGKLSHLVTRISLKLNQESEILSVIKALHPTPALGAFPKEEGHSWLLRYEERLPRYRYGAPFGVILPEEVYVYVAIRNLQWWGNKVKLFVGCGVVEESDYAQERKEILAKLSAVKEMFHVE